MKKMRLPKEIILVCIRGYAAYALSYRNLEDMMKERGVTVDHSTISRWVIPFLTLLKQTFRQHKRPVVGSGRMDETYIQVRGKWKYLYRAVEKEESTVDFLQRDRAAATAFFQKAIRQNGEPEKVTMDKGGANKAAMDGIHLNRDNPIEVRQIKYLNNIVEQDHRGVKRITKPMMGFKYFRSARNVLAGIELMHMIRKGQMITPDGADLSFAYQFYALAA